MARNDLRCPQCGARNEADKARCRICATPLEHTGGAPEFTPEVLREPAPQPFVPFGSPGTQGAPRAAPPTPPEPRPEPSRQRTGHRRNGLSVPVWIGVTAIGLFLGYYYGPGRWLFHDDKGSATSIADRSLSVESSSSDSVSPGAEGWVPFTDPDGYFAIDFPGTPTPEQHPHPAPDRPPYTVWSSGSVGAGRFFLDATVHPDLEELAAGVARDLGGTTRSVQVSEDVYGHPAADSVVDLPDGSSVYQYVVLGDAEVFVLEADQAAGSSKGLADLLKLKVDFRILR